MALLTIGDQFPDFELTALKGGDLRKVNANQPEDGPGGQIDIAFTAPVTTFTVRYDNLMRTAPRPTGTNNDQAAFVTGFRAKRPTVC